MLGLGCVERMPQKSTAAKLFKNTPEAKRSVGKPRKRRMGDVENDLQKTGAKVWRKTARDNNAWNRSFEEDRRASGG